jgi:catechol 2,3-dioxygenase-like lactoylglutathione lyase family enzyme
MRIQSLHHVQITIPPDSEAEGRVFYCHVLGLRELPKPESLQGRGGFWLELGALQIHLGVQKDLDRLAQRSHLAFEVDDLEQWRAQLIEAGIAVDESIPIPGYSRFECRDPFGNRLEFIQVL